MRLNTNDLRNTLKNFNGVIPAKHSNPNYTAIKITALNDCLEFEGINDSLSLKKRLYGQFEGLDLKIVVNFAILNEIVNKISDNETELIIQDKILRIENGKSKYSINLMEYDYFPKVDYNVEGTKIEVNDLGNLIDKVSFASDSFGKRPILSGVNFSFDENGLNIQATDSFRLSNVNVNGKYEKKSFTIVKKSIDIISRLGLSKMTIGEDTILFEKVGLKLKSRLLEGSYPDTSRLIGTVFTKSVEIKKNDFIQAIERCSIMGNEIVHLIAKDNTLTIESESAEIGKAKEEIEVQNNGELNLFCSSKYLLEALKVFDDEEIKIDFESPLRPFIINSKNGNVMELLLPVKEK